MRKIDFKHKFKDKKNTLICIVLILIYIFYKMGNKFLSIEYLSICPGIGCDIVKKGNEIDYKISTAIYNIENENKISSEIISAIGKNIPETREIRQNKLNRKFIFGLEKVIICGDDFASFGINNLIDSLFHNKDVNDTAYMIVCSGKAEDILGFNVPGYYSSSDYINGIIERAEEFNFYSPNFKFIDAYVRVASEGRNFVTPHITIKDNQIEMDGTAVFNKEKMVTKLDNKDSKIMNLMRANNGRGILTLQKDPKGYISFYGVSKHKVQCTKNENGYNFKINIFLDGEIASNTTDKNLSTNPENIANLEKEFQNEVKKECGEFIDKMQNGFKSDCLELGDIAASKYGRRKGIDWNKEVINSKIDLDVKVKISKSERGDF